MGRFVKLGPGHYRVVHDDKPEKGDGKPWSLCGRRQPVPEHERDPHKKYCECGRELNSGNKSGVCVRCNEEKPR